MHHPDISFSGIQTYSLLSQLLFPTVSSPGNLYSSYFYLCMPLENGLYALAKWTDMLWPMWPLGGKSFRWWCIRGSNRDGWPPFLGGYFITSQGQDVFLSSNGKGTLDLTVKVPFDWGEEVIQDPPLFNRIFVAYRRFSAFLSHLSFFIISCLLQCLLLGWWWHSALPFTSLFSVKFCCCNNQSHSSCFFTESSGSLWTKEQMFLWGGKNDIISCLQELWEKCNDIA